jgi:hypothetical protein
MSVPQQFRAATRSIGSETSTAKIGIRREIFKCLANNPVPQPISAAERKLIPYLLTNFSNVLRKRKKNGRPIVES